MNSFKLLWHTMKAVNAHVILAGYVVFLVACGGLFCLLEPQTFPTLGNALWCIFQMVTTIGFGDIVAKSLACRIVSVVVGLSSLVVIGLITGIVVNFFSERMRLRSNQSVVAFGHRLEHLSELSPEELKQMEQQYRTFISKK